jgi:hypothetical protein
VIIMLLAFRRGITSRKLLALMLSLYFVLAAWLVVRHFAT